MLPLNVCCGYPVTTGIQAPLASVVKGSNLLFRLTWWFKLQPIKKYLRVDRKKIHLIRFILEGYDGIATLTTIDPQRGIVLLNIPPGCEDDVESVIREMKKTVVITCSKVTSSVV